MGRVCLIVFLECLLKNHSTTGLWSCLLSLHPARGWELLGKKSRQEWAFGKAVVVAEVLCLRSICVPAVFTISCHDCVDLVFHFDTILCLLLAENGLQSNRPIKPFVQ